jgi:transcriptional regulator with PAS, ATPase and Fis domain
MRSGRDHTDELLRVCPRVDDATILIKGETGTGKELIAEAIHNFSVDAVSATLHTDIRST